MIDGEYGYLKIYGQAFTDTVGYFVLDSGGKMWRIYTPTDVEWHAGTAQDHTPFKLGDVIKSKIDEKSLYTVGDGDGLVFDHQHKNWISPPKPVDDRFFRLVTDTVPTKTLHISDQSEVIKIVEKKNA